MEGELPDMHAGRPVHVYSGERVVFHELRRVLGLAQAGKLAVTAKRATPTDACVRRIGEALMLPDLELEEPEKLRSTGSVPGGRAGTRLRLGRRGAAVRLVQGHGKQAGLDAKGPGHAGGRRGRSAEGGGGAASG